MNENVLENNFVFILVYLDKDFIDIAGNEYCSYGYVKAKEYTEDIDIRYGLYGIPWGKTHYFPYEKIENGNWVVVKTNYEELITVDRYYNRVKFEKGMILHMGNIRSAAQFIIDNKDDPQQFLKEEALWVTEEEIAGSDKWFENL